MSGLYSLAAPLIWSLDPEFAHDAAIKALASGLVPARARPPASSLKVDVLGLHFDSPLGMAAGFDKNAVAVDGVLGLGFGFCEVGTVTPAAQAGNARPRLFRLPADRAIINRMGFNNDGHDVVHERLAARADLGGVIGVNIGANKSSSDRVGDYVAGVERFSDVASYLVINVSSPNTPGLRELQAREALRELIGRVGAVRGRTPRTPPLLLKIAPDITETALADIIAACIAGGVDGLVVTNTTVSRPPLRSTHRDQTGGLSGRPLFEPSTRVLARARQIAGDRLVLVGVGGIDSAETAWRKVCAGADLVQLYTGLVYEGPGLIGAIHRGLAARLEEQGMTSLAEARASAVTEWLI